MAGSRSSWSVIAGFAGLVVVQPMACKPQPGGGADTPAEAVQASALDVVGEGVVVPALERFVASASLLEEATASWADAPEDASARVSAQDAWVDAMLAWQELEVMQIGPLGSSLTAVAGADRRDEVYSWPTVNPCRVDQETVEEAWSESGWYTENLVNVYGLDAMEYLLWAPEGNDCPGQVEINADGSWAALGPAGVAANRAAYSAALAGHLAEQAVEVLDLWHPDGGDFSGQLAGSAGSPYDSDQAALNAVFDALFYIESSTKDRKLALPLGLTDCAADRCLEDVEAWHSGMGAPAIAANLRGFRALFTGGDSVGMDDLLIELGEEALVTEVLADVDVAIGLADAIEVPLQDAIVEQPADVEALHAAVKRVADALKGDIATVLTLQIPAEAAGDND